MARQEHERAADVDREEIAERLRQAVAEGRLDLDEYDERVTKAYAARTYGDLDRLVRDLPKPVATPAAQPRPDAVRRWLVEQWRPWATSVMICVAIWLLTSIMSTEVVYFWPLWIAVPWGVVLLCRTIFGLSSGEPHQSATRRSGRPPAI